MGIWSFTCSETSWPRSSFGAELAPNTTNSIRIILIRFNYHNYADALHMIERPDLAEVYRGAYSLIRDFAQ